MRTVKEAISELRKSDPNTALTERAIRRMVITHEIPSVKVGCKFLVNMAILEEYLNTGTPVQNNSLNGIVRKIDEKRG